MRSFKFSKTKPEGLLHSCILIGYTSSCWLTAEMLQSSFKGRSWFEASLHVVWSVMALSHMQVITWCFPDKAINIQNSPKLWICYWRHCLTAVRVRHPEQAHKCCISCRRLTDSQEICFCFIGSMQESPIRITGDYSWYRAPFLMHFYNIWHLCCLVRYSLYVNVFFFNL